MPIPVPRPAPRSCDCVQRGFARRIEPIESTAEIPGMSTSPTISPVTMCRTISPGLRIGMSVTLTFRGGADGCACRKSNPNILVVQPAQDRAAKNGPGQFDGARDRRILLQRQMRPYLVVIFMYDSST